MLLDYLTIACGSSPRRWPTTCWPAAGSRCIARGARGRDRGGRSRVSVVLVRVDDRLLHGQVLLGWGWRAGGRSLTW